MGETLIRIDATELTTVRITCQSCHRTAETKLADLAATFKRGNVCPFCNASFAIKGGFSESAFIDLQAALEDFAKARDAFRVEFTIPAETLEN
jgi:hypothetical protein